MIRLVFLGDMIETIDLFQLGGFLNALKWRKEFGGRVGRIWAGKVGGLPKYLVLSVLFKTKSVSHRERYWICS